MTYWVGCGMAGWLALLGRYTEQLFEFALLRHFESFEVLGDVIETRTLYAAYKTREFRHQQRLGLGQIQYAPTR